MRRREITIVRAQSSGEMADGMREPAQVARWTAERHGWAVRYIGWDTAGDVVATVDVPIPQAVESREAIETLLRRSVRQKT